jgi:hypothetical protein
LGLEEEAKTMRGLPAFRQRAVEQIGAALSQEEIERLVMEATGEDVYNVFASKGDPRAALISKTLAQLEDTGIERWLLSFILIAIAQEKLRMLIVKTWPNTLVRLPQIEGQVTNALKWLSDVLNTPLPIELRYQLKPKHDAFDEIRQRIAELYVYKSLHEFLHVLHLKLVVAGPSQGGTAAGTDFTSILARCDAVASQAPAVLLGSTSGERGWISQLATLAAALKTAIGASDTAGCLRASDAILALTRVHLARLNGEVFRAAKELSFEALVKDLPLDIETRDAFTQLVHAVRELKPTVIARALKQSMWQKVENEISLIADFFNSTDQEFSAFSEHWFALKSRVLWLANLDPDDPWAKLAQQYSDEIDDGLSREKLDDDIRRRFETYRNLFRFRFLAIDNALKQDCTSLRMIDAPLTKILKELTQ